MTLAALFQYATLVHGEVNQADIHFVAHRHHAELDGDLLQLRGAARARPKPALGPARGERALGVLTSERWESKPKIPLAKASPRRPGARWPR